MGVMRTIAQVNIRHNALSIPTLTYGSERRELINQDKKRIETFQMRFPMSVLRSKLREGEK
jgi:hypothetical protein